MRLKRLTLVASVVSAVLALVGWSVGGASGSGRAKPVTITFWHSYSTNAASPELIELNKVVIPAFEKQHPGIKVKQVAFDYNDLRQKLLTGIAAGQLPDVIRADIIWVPEFGNLGVLAPLDQQLPDFKSLAGALFAGPLATNAWKGHYYGLPLDTNTRVLMYNQQALASAGITSPPQTFGDLRADAAKLKEKGVYAFADGGTGGWNVLPWIWSAGGSVTDPAIKKASGYLNSPKSVAGVQLLVDLHNDGAIPDLILGAQGGIQTSDGLPQGKYATVLDGPWMFPIFAAQYPGFNLQTSLVPAGSGGSVSVVGGEDIVMTKASKNKDAVAEFIRFMLSPFAQTAMGKVGQMPVRNDLGPKLVKIRPYYAIFLKQLANARPRTPSPKWPQIDQVLGTEIAKAIKGDMTAQQAMDEAAKQIDALLKG